MLPLYSAVLSSDGLFADLIDLHGLYGAGRLRLTVDRGSVRLSAGAAPEALDVIGDYSVGVFEVGIPLTRLVKVERLTGNSSTILVEILPHTADQRNVTATISDGGNEVSASGVTVAKIPSVGRRPDTSAIAVRREMLCGLQSWMLPTHRPILDPRRHAGMSAITNGNLTITQIDSGAGGYLNKAIRITASAAGSGGPTLPMAAYSETEMTGIPVRCGAQVHFSINCSDWSKVSYFEIYFCQNGSIVDFRSARLVWGGVTAFGATDPAYASAWNGKYRNMCYHAANFVASGNPAPWGKDARFFDITGLRFAITTTGPVTIDIARIYSEDWPAGVIVPMFDGTYDTASDFLLKKMIPAGLTATCSVHTMLGGKDPDPATLIALQNAGVEVVPHFHSASGGGAYPIDGTQTSAVVSKALLEQTLRLQYMLKMRAGVSRFNFHYQNKGTVSDSADFAGTVLKKLGVSTCRGNTTDAEFGVNPANSTYVNQGHYYQTFASQRGRYNITPLQFYNNMSNSAGYYDAPTVANVPCLMDYVSAADTCATVCAAYGHEIVSSPTSSDNTPAFMSDFIADISARANSGSVVVLTASELDALTYSRPGPVKLRWDGEWVYSDDPTTIAF